MLYLEYANITPHNRNRVIESDKFPLLVKQAGAVPMYRSVFLYDESLIEHMKKTKSIKNFEGIRYIEEIPIDIDKGSNSDQYLLKKLYDTITQLSELDIDKESYQVYYSGRGFHIMISSEVFEFEPGPELPIQVRLVMDRLKLSSDTSVYKPTAIIRAPHSLNEKSDLFKIPLTAEEAKTLSMEQIRALAKVPRYEYEYHRLKGYKQAADLVSDVAVEVPKKDRVYTYDSIAHLYNYVCIQTMLNVGPQEGTRNNSVLRIASHLKWVGIPEEYAKKILILWNNSSEQSLDEKLVMQKTEYVYNTPIKYGCFDEILKFYCRSSCHKYKMRDVDETPVLNTKDLNKAYKDRLKLYDIRESFINLKDIFGLQNDCILWPGELVTFMADTGMNKTSLLQNIMVGFNMKTQEIKRHKQRILFYETELGPGSLQERFLTIVSGYTKKELRNHYDKIEYYSSMIDNISVQVGLKTLAGIESMLQQYQIEVLVVDYIEKIMHPMRDKGIETAAIADIMRTLSEFAVKYNIVIVAISQINRTSAANKEGIHIHSGKGSSAIETSSRRLFSIDGELDSAYRKISMIKANNDTVWKNILIERQENWRFLRL